MKSGHILFQTLIVTCVAAVGVFVSTSIATATTGETWTPFDLPQLRQTMLRSAQGASYRIIVASPAGPAPATGYPVIYVVDGNAWTGMVAEIIRVNIGLGVQSRVEPAVVVGIGYPTDAAFDVDRRKLDLTSAVPANSGDPDIGKGETGGDVAFMNFIDTVVKPVIEARFKTDRSRQTLLGHSLGGRFTLQTLLDRPTSFQTYVALSPSIWWNHRSILDEAQRVLAQPGRPLNTRVFLSVGSFEQAMTPAYLQHARGVAISSGETPTQGAKDVADNQEFYNRAMMVSNARGMAALLAAHHIRTEFVEFPDEDHFSAVPAALGRAVPYALADRLPPS